MKRRERSDLKRSDCIKALAEFAPRVQRFMESSDAAGFAHGPGTLGTSCAPENINIMFLVRGNFGVAENLFEAIRVLAGHRIAADDKRPRRSKP